MPTTHPLRFFKEILNEDIGSGDITSTLLIPATSQSSAKIVAKADGVVSGLRLIPALLAAYRSRISVRPLMKDGQRVRAGDTVAELEGKTRDILTLERTLLNLLQQLSGTATLTRQYVDAVNRTSAHILDTRKTVPGMRALQKKAVLDGGGYNHRFGLHDMVLIKDNHLAHHQNTPLHQLIKTMRKQIPSGMKIEIEVDSLEMLERAIACPVDIIMLDNFSVAQAQKAVKIIRSSKKKVLIEVSGNITLKNVLQYAKIGVDRISVGALTHSARAVDIALDFE